MSELPPDAERQGTVPAVEPEADDKARHRRRARLYAWAFLLAAFFVVLDVNADEVDDLARRGTKQARRGRKPKAAS